MTTALVDTTKNLPEALNGTGFSKETVEALEQFSPRGEWMHSRRQAAWEKFDALRMPTRKDEHWRFTSLRGLDPKDVATYTTAGASVDPNAAAEIAAAIELVDTSLTAGDYAGRIVTINNAQRCDAIDIPAALPEGVVFQKLRHALRDNESLVRKHFGTVVPITESPDDKFVALNEAMTDAGIFLYVPRNTKVELPFHAPLVHSVDGATIQRRVLVVLEEGAEATFVEEFLSADPSHTAFSNAVVELVAGQAAHLHYITIQDYAVPVRHVATHRLRADRDAQVDWTAVGLGASRGKNRMEVVMAGEGSNVKLTGAYYLTGTQQMDYDTKQVHVAPNTYSDLAYKGVIDDKAHAIWRGIIAVDNVAQGTDAFQENKNLMLKSGAHADSIPGLNIEANEVRCTHASTTSKIDQEQLFYLQARGIDRAAATREIVRGFFMDALARIGVEQVREQVREALWQRMDRVNIDVK